MIIEHLKPIPLKKFVEMLPENKNKFLRKTLESLEGYLTMFFWGEKNFLENTRIKIIIFEQDGYFIGFQTYSINTPDIDLDYAFVEEEKRGRIGYALASIAINEGIKENCKAVKGDWSEQARRLVGELKSKYSQLDFEGIPTGYDAKA